jgi:hypothetical protein
MVNQTGGSLHEVLSSRQHRFAFGHRADFVCIVDCLQIGGICGDSILWPHLRMRDGRPLRAIWQVRSSCEKNVFGGFLFDRK